MKHLMIGMLLFLGTMSAYAGPDTTNKRVIGGDPAGVFFVIEGQPSPWLCRPEGAGVVSCDSQGKRYTCEFQAPPVFFTNCGEGKDETPLGIIVIPVQ